MKSIASLVLNNFTHDYRVYKEASSMVKAGYQVTVVALHESDLPEHETKEKIKIHRIKLKTRNWSKAKLVQLIKYFEFMHKVIKLYKKSDVIHCNDLEPLPIAAYIKVFKNKKVKIVYDAHELETEKHINPGGLLYQFKKTLEMKMLGYVDQMITVGEGIAKEYVKRYHIPRPVLIMNCPPKFNIEKKHDLFRKKFSIPENDLIFLYQGSLSRGRGIEKILDAFQNHHDRKKHLMVMGNGALRNKIIAISKVQSNIHYQPAVPVEELIFHTASADFGLFFYEPVNLNNYYSCPNKFFEYVMAELPIISAPLYEMKRFFSQYNFGYLSKGFTVNDLEDVLNEVNTKDVITIKQNLRAMKKIYNWEKQEEKLLRIYNEL